LSRLLQEPVSHLRGVGPEKATLLRNELGVETIEDLLQHYPYRYVDKTLIRPIREAMMMQDHVLVSGVLSPFNYEGPAGKEGWWPTFRTTRGSLELIWFRATA
jgi:ATP-dependent DNA helicase RecG